MDNIIFSVTGYTRETFADAIRLAFRVCGHKVVGGLRTCPDKGMILYWTKSLDEDFRETPYAMDDGQIENLVWGWLQSADYGPEPGHDGSNSKGWHVYTEEWGHVDGQWEAFLAIKPIWAWHGK